MAQHDYVIDNSTGANVRADINNALLAISSNNSGSSAPSTTYALQTFANTTDSMLQLRNSANNGFVNLRKFDGTLPLPDGTNSAPSLFFDDDTNTGIFSSAADTFDIATGGTGRLQIDHSEITFNESGADTDFRIEGDNEANLFFVDAGNDRVGVGTNSPLVPLHVVTSDTDVVTFESTNANSAGVQLRIRKNSSSPANDDTIAVLDFQGEDSSGASTTYGQIQCISEDVVNNQEKGVITFVTNNSNSTGERMRLTSDGSLLIGITGKSHASANADDLCVGNNDSTSEHGITIGSNVAGGLRFADTASGSAGVIEYNHTNGSMTLSTETVPRLTITSAGEVGIGTNTSGNIVTPSTLLHVDRGTSDSSVAFFENQSNTAYSSAAEGAINTVLVLKSTTSTGQNDQCVFIQFNLTLSGQTGSIQEIGAVRTGSGQGALVFRTRNSSTGRVERMRLDDAGNLLVGRTDAGNTGNGHSIRGGDGAIFSRNSTGETMQICRNSNDGDFVQFRSGDTGNASSIGEISKSGGNVVYGGTSDYRLKENVVTLSNAITRLKTLKPYRFNFKSHPTRTVDGFFAHEVAETVSEAVVGEKDAMEKIFYTQLDADEDKIPEDKKIGDFKEYSTTDIAPQGLDPSKLVPLMTAALQEAISKIEVLETKVAALEAA